MIHYRMIHFDLHSDVTWKRVHVKAGVCIQTSAVVAANSFDKEHSTDLVSRSLQIHLLTNLPVLQ